MDGSSGYSLCPPAFTQKLNHLFQLFRVQPRLLAEGLIPSVVIFEKLKFANSLQGFAEKWLGEVDLLFPEI